ncbi:Divalent-cation tolerance protein CutA [Orchesella cincta]|uniref:Divalent-cation tolerance protein CutA n=1 Tax=Orchesella cincta TaxID=48709 RepID=A0A1D2M8I0_ORCCI|nr:Divalent-cation tolerance protein CutA [Orchesella cincta]
MELAKSFARDLVQQQLAAIVNIMPMESAVYMWEGQLEEDPEVLLLIYSQECQLPSLEAYIRENHPDEEPGLAALPIVGGSSSFLDWIRNNSMSANDTGNLII